MNSGVEYIKYRWKAKRRHGVHSPFIYDLTDNCFRTPISDELIERLSSLDKKLKNNSDTIEITDFGAGSKKLGNHRTLKSIYKTSSSKGRFGKLLFQLVHHYQPKQVLEFGTSMGIGTVCMASGNKNSTITTVEGCPNTFAAAQSNIGETGLSNVHMINSTFVDFIATLKDESYDLVFIDGHHDGKALLDYLNALDSYTTNETIFILDDIRWSDSMLEAWNGIVNDERYHVTIDLFRMGMVLKRPEQEKEHFVIR